MHRKMRQIPPSEAQTHRVYQFQELQKNRDRSKNGLVPFLFASGGRKLRPDMPAVNLLLFAVLLHSFRAEGRRAGRGRRCCAAHVLLELPSGFHVIGATLVHASMVEIRLEIASSTSSSARTVSSDVKVVTLFSIARRRIMNPALTCAVEFLLRVLTR